MGLMGGLERHLGRVGWVAGWWVHVWCFVTSLCGRDG